MMRRLLLAPTCTWPARVAATAGALGLATVRATWAGAPDAPPGGADRTLRLASMAGADGAAVAAALVHMARLEGADGVLTGPASAKDHAILAAACVAEGLLCVGARGAAALRLAKEAPADWVRWGASAEAWVPAPARAAAAALGAWLAAAPRMRLALPLAADRAGHVVSLALQQGEADLGGQVDLWEAPAPAPPPAVAQAMGEVAAALARALGEVGVVVLSAGSRPDGGLQLVWSPFTWPLCQLGEELAGVDLIEWQIRLAGGEALPCPPTGVAPLGAALQALVRAAAPGALALPPCPEVSVATPLEAAAGETAGARPIAALCARADGPQEARRRLQAALALAQVEGGGPSNLPALRRALGRL